MTHSNLMVEVQDPYILVAMRGTCLRAKYRKQDAPWLAPEEYGEDCAISGHFAKTSVVPPPPAVARRRKLGNPNAPGLSLVFRLNVDVNHRFTHLLFKCVLDTVANVVGACDAHIRGHY